MRIAAFALLGALMAVPAAADEPEVDLKAGPGLDQVMGNCGACHSLAYIQMNSPFLNAAGWNAEVTKMIKAFGAPITDTTPRRSPIIWPRTTAHNSRVQRAD